MPKKGIFTGKFNNGKHSVEVKLQLITWSEENVFFVYSPAMDLVGYGQTQEEADNSFTITIDETLKYMVNKSTIFDELERLGWSVNRKKKKLIPPDFEKLLASNEDLAEVSKRPNYSLKSQSHKFDLV